MAAQKQDRIYQIKVTLHGSKPPIWRRLLVSSVITLPELHEVLQTAMGWYDTHLHQFIADGRYFGVPDPDFGFDEMIDEATIKLNRLLTRENASITYEYDFGDGWEHKIVLEKILPPDAATTVPICIKGKRACPPEDVGGIWGYAEFLKVINNPEHPDHEEQLEWIGGSFDPEYFSLEEINEQLAG
jgi:hypothetical protein